MTTPAQILSAVRERLEDAGRKVFLGKVIDPMHDPLPAITVHFTPEGDQPQQTRPKLTRQMQIVVECWDEFDTDPLIGIANFSEEIRKEITLGDGFDATDTLGGLANRVVYEQMVLMTRERNTATGQVVINIVY